MLVFGEFPREAFELHWAGLSLDGGPTSDVPLFEEYPSHLMRTFKQRWQIGLASSHLTRRILEVCQLIDWDEKTAQV
jgi:hypothetical protein